jgi:DNA repair photolyase
MIIREYKASSALNRSGMKELEYTLNPYSGCFHGCVYCYAIDMTSKRDASENWGEVIYVKTNLPELLRKEVIGKKRGMVGISSVTDPYQAVETKYRLTRDAINVLLKNGFRVTVQTKSPLVARDVDLFLKYRETCDVGMTITTMDSKIALSMEPHAPSPVSRGMALKRMAESGVKLWIFAGPIIRGVNDSRDGIEKIFMLASETGARIIYDTYVPYKGPSALMSRTLNMEGKSNSYYTDKAWQENIMNNFLELGSSYNVRVNSESEEWLMEFRENFRTF